MSAPIAEIPFSLHLGIEVLEAADGRARCRLPLRPELLNSNDVAHGGVSFALSDTCMGQALRTLLQEGERCVTVETKMNYFRPGAGELRSESQVVHRGRSLANVECRIYAGDQLVASSNGTFAIRQREQVRGRPRTAP